MSRKHTNHDNRYPNLISVTAIIAMLTMLTVIVYDYSDRDSNFIGSEDSGNSVGKTFSFGQLLTGNVVADTEPILLSNNGSSEDINLSVYPEMFFKDGVFDAVLVVGRFAQYKDVVGINDIVASLQRYNSNPLPLGIVKFDDEAAKYDMYNRNLIIVGGACSNSVVAQLLGNPESCTANEIEGVGKIEVIRNKNPNKYVLLVHGYNANDTLLATRVVANWQTLTNGQANREIFFSTDKLCVTGTLNAMSVAKCGDNFVVQYGALNITTVNGTGTITRVRLDESANIYLDDVFVGTGQALLQNVAAGSHLVRVEFEGYVNNTLVNVLANTQTDLVVTLYPPFMNGICIDSDQGTMTSIKGYTYIKDDIDKILRNESDTCVNGMLKEYYCGDNYMMNMTVPCYWGSTCVAGRCIYIQYTSDYTPRIAYNSGMVNQHIDISNGVWMTDEDGISNSSIDKLTYCKKFYPDTLSVEEYKSENIYDWRDMGNFGGYAFTAQSYNCSNDAIHSCIDTDEGINYYSKGFVYMDDVLKGEDLCIDELNVKEYYCDERNHSINVTRICTKGSKCVDGACVLKGVNAKNPARYSDKEAFVISDADWRDVLPLVPLTIWTKQYGDESLCQKGYGTPNDVCVYPSLIYHSESGKLYADMAYGAGITASSDSAGAAGRALDGNIISIWNSGNSDEAYLKLDLQEIRSFNRIDLYQNADHYFVDIYVSEDDITYNKIVDKYILDMGIEFTTFRNVFNFDMLNARYVKFVLTDSSLQHVYPNWKAIAEIKIYNDAYYDYASYDADSIIHFMQQYSPDRVTLIGNTPQELDNLLVAPQELGAGLNSNIIQRISVSDYISYWDSYDDVVYVKNDYELALLASTYASWINAPLIIEGTDYDVDSVFQGKNIICVGSNQRSCNEQYDLNQLQKKYVDETNTEKLMLVNPNDWNIKVWEEFQPDKSSSKIYDLYSKTSLAAPILASAKHEIIISTTSTDYDVIGAFVKSKVQSLMPQVINNPKGIKMTSGSGDLTRYSVNSDYYIYGYLTIFSSPDAIPSQKFMYTVNSINEMQLSLDPSIYGDIYLDDGRPDLAVGRIQGMTTSDVSGYVARDLFFDKIRITDNMLFTAMPLYNNTGGDYSLDTSDRWSKTFMNAGYTAQCKVYNVYLNWIFNLTEGSVCTINEADTWSEFYKNNDLITYIDHGGPYSAGMLSNDIPYLSNSFIHTHACSTCASHDAKSFCNNAIRKGSLGYTGSVSVSWDSDMTLLYMINNIYKNNLSLGQAFSKSYIPRTPDTLIGDPTFNVNPKYILKEAVLWQKQIV